jgi:thioredoxin-dependent peroxiredoxin
MTLAIGMKAPEFTLQGDNNQKISLKDFRGKQVVLYFYPKDATPGCTQEACDFRDEFDQFHKKDVVILGISKDSVASHQKFKKNHSLPFFLLSDETGAVCEDYGVWKEKSMMGKKYFGIDRTTFIIDQKGVISHIWPGVKVKDHVADVLEVL